MNTLVTQSNFKKLRTQYGFKLRDIADICKLSSSTVNNFEKCKGEYTKVNARTYNGDMMIQTLQSLIDNKISEKTKHEEEKKVESIKKKRSFRLSPIKSMDFYNNVIIYCRINNTSIKAIADKCGLNTGFFTPWYCNKYPLITVNSAKKISENMDWSIDDMVSGKFVKVDKKEETPQIETKLEEKPKRRFGLGPEVRQQILEEETKEFKLPLHAYDIKYTYDQNKGEYYISYAVPVYHRQAITKEKFLELIGG